jgi:hypothetical protein
MASIVLGLAGSAIGANIGGAFLSLSAATIGGLIGSTIGSVIDSAIVASLTPGQNATGARLESLRVVSSTEGVVIPRLFGRARIGGNLIWATDFREETRTQRSGGKAGGGRGRVTEYSYFASFAVGICEGPITGIGRIWADGKELDLTGLTWRWYPGDEGQVADPLVSARMGPADTPAYRGLAYAVFEELPLERFGNRLPQLTFEVFRPLVEPDTVEGLLRAVTIIPGSGEAVYATEPVREISGGLSVSGSYVGGGTDRVVNFNAAADQSDIETSLDRLIAACPGLEMVSLVVSWFGDDLRCGTCKLRPGVEVAQKNATPVWSVNGVLRSEAHVVSQIDGRPAYGGTTSDRAVVQAIAAIKARGLRVTFYPFILMDVPPGNTRPDPYSAGAGTVGQPVFPWRGRITCSPAAGFAGTVDKTAAAAAQVGAFFGMAAVGQFAVTETTVSFTGSPSDWGLRRMILHYAHLCAAAGGVDAFLIGTEMRGLTQIRSGASSYPAVQSFMTLAADVRSILGPAPRISYAADWSEYFGHQPGDGSGDVFFHLDPLWAHPAISFVGIDNYMPLSDWRDGWSHADAAAGWPAVQDRAYLQANVEGGEGFDWFYASAADRAAQTRTPITDGAAGKPWVFRYKDLRAWWSNTHVNRPGGVETGGPTAWVPQSKPIVFTEYGCPAVDRGTNQPNVFFDPKSSESFLPYHSRGWRDETIQRAYLEAVLVWWASPARNPVSTVYGAPMIDLSDCAAWTWDARPYPHFPALSDVWADGDNWRLGHWLTGRLGSPSLAALVRALCRAGGLPDAQIDVSGLWGAVEGYVIAAVESPRQGIETLARHFGFDMFEGEGRLRFVMRGRAPVATLTADDLARNRDGDDVELMRAQETELPLALKWQVGDEDGNYNAGVVEARRSVAGSARVQTDAFPFVVPLEEAERRCRRALHEAWIGRETAAFALPPSRLALDPGDVLGLSNDGRTVTYRISAIADRDERVVEAIRHDRASFDQPPGPPRRSLLQGRNPPARPTGLFLDLPQLSEDALPHRPRFAVSARPWPGDIALYRSPAADGWSLFATIAARARIGALVDPLTSGPLWRLDRGSALVVELFDGTLESADTLQVLGGANVLAVLGAAAVWEVVQFGQADLIGPGRYRLTGLLRGQLGTDDALGAPAGAPVVVLDEAAVPLAFAESELGLPFNFRAGPASRAVTDEAYVQSTFTARGRGLLSWSGCQPRLRRLATGDLRLRWIRRSRALAADGWEAAELPLPEGAELWDIEILNGPTVVRAVTGLAASVWTYTAAQQSADFGVPVSALSIRLWQIGPLGRGVPLVATIPVTEAE